MYARTNRCNYERGSRTNYLRSSIPHCTCILYWTSQEGRVSLNKYVVLFLCYNGGMCFISVIITSSRDARSFHKITREPPSQQVYKVSHYQACSKVLTWFVTLYKCTHYIRTLPVFAYITIRVLKKICFFGSFIKVSGHIPVSVEVEDSLHEGVRTFLRESRSQLAKCLSEGSVENILLGENETLRRHTFYLTLNKPVAIICTSRQARVTH
jgi:hypothetical protein